MKRALALQELAAPALLVVAAGLLGTVVSLSTQAYFTDALVSVAIVVALYTFIGNSGVLSFGHISFVAIGAWTAGVLSVPTGQKPAIMPNLAHFMRPWTTGNLTSIVLAGVIAGVCALVVALPLMRLSGLAAGIATFGVLEITHNMLQYEERIGPGFLTTAPSLPFSISRPRSQPNWNLLRESSIDQELLVSISTPRSIEPTSSSKVDVPGSMLRFAIRSIGGRFQLSARALATPGKPARACEIVPPSGRSRMPSRISQAFSAGVPSSSYA